MLTPMQRYEWATGPEGWLTVAGWEALAADLDTTADLRAPGHRAYVGGEAMARADILSVLGYCAAKRAIAQKYIDRSRDCLARADRLRAA